MPAMICGANVMTPANWDQSVLSVTPEELSGMDDEDRARRLFEEMNRASDLLEAVTRAFAADLGRQDAKTLQHIANAIHALSRKH